MSRLPAPSKRADFGPVLLIPMVALLGYLLVNSGATWLTLTLAGLATGMMIFIIASGLTLVFGLMDVLNFGHGAFIGVGAYLAFTVLSVTSGLALAPGLGSNMLALAIAVLVATTGAGMLGLAFERLVIKRVYGDHLKQILITMGGSIVIEQVLLMIWGPQELQVELPTALRGTFLFAGAAIEKYRVLVLVAGLVLFSIMAIVLLYTRVGLLVRAGVEAPEMVRALGFRIRKLFVGVFVAGSALAGFGGVMWVLYRGTLSANIGSELMIMVFIVIVIGGLGSIAGCFIGAMLIAVVSNYVAFLIPNAAAASTILVMVAVLVWRPNGLYPVVIKK
jgi:branched-chain amino acid transport system permease protein